VPGTLGSGPQPARRFFGAPAFALLFFLAGAAGNGQSSSCLVLGLRYEKGISVPKDEGKAMTYLKKACDAGDKTACERLAKGAKAP
jgi:TPR repeat protein